jgi:hypothetical protein
MYLLHWPPQRQRPLLESILALGAFGILLYLAQGGLPDIQKGIAR